MIEPRPVDPGLFDKLFDQFVTSVFRLEALPGYDVGDDEDFAAWKAGKPEAPFSVVTSPWAARLATTAMAGKKWSRVRVVSEPITDYERWELGAYQQTSALGEDIAVVGRSRAAGLTGTPDFWLFDGDQPGGWVVEMVYDDQGRPGTHLLHAEPETVRKYRVAARAAQAMATPLNVYLAEHRDDLRLTA